MSPFYRNLGIWGENMGHEREISGDRPFDLTGSTGCLLVVSEKVRNDYLYPVFKKMSPINGCYCSN